MSEPTHPPTPQDDARSSAPPSSTGSIPQLNVEPLHHPQEMAHVEVPHNVENIPHGTTLPTGKALLAKKMAATGTSFYSPSDALVSPCTQKLSSQKGKRWANAKVKPAVFGKSNLNASSSLFASQGPKDEETEGDALTSTKLSAPPEPADSENHPSTTPAHAAPASVNAS